MNLRQIEILHLLMLEQYPSLDHLKEVYNISQRTLYYDVENLNHHLKKYGKIVTRNNIMKFEGNLSLLLLEMEEEIFIPYLESKDRQHIIIFKILNQELFSLSEIGNQLKVSRNTVYKDIKKLKRNLKDQEIELLYGKDFYYLSGDELKIRNIYIQLLNQTEFSFREIDDEIKLFNNRNNLGLSYHSQYLLSKVVKFCQNRIDNKFILTKFPLQDSVAFRKDIDSLIQTKSSHEENYLTAYILSLSSYKKSDPNEMIIDRQVKDYVQELLKVMGYVLVLDIKWEKKFVTQLENHLKASYYRIKYNFPVFNEMLTHLKSNYFSLYHIVKRVLRSIGSELRFYNIRDDEIGYIVAYFAAYFTNLKKADKKPKEVILVCPEGRLTSKYLKNKLIEISPNLNITEVYKVDDLQKKTFDYDYIVSTIELGIYPNLIKVNPILTINDKFTLAKRLSAEFEQNKSLVYEIITLFKKNKNVPEEFIFQELYSLLFLDKKERCSKPMLKDLLTHQRIKRKESVSDWKEAIREASSVLLEEGTIEDVYIDSMISAVEKYGPYNVLADYFALPHASGKEGVNELSMSMLILDEAVDMLGKPVKIFMVLATKDNKSHLTALSSLTKILLNDDNMEIFMKGDPNEIIELINKESEENM